MARLTPITKKDQVSPKHQAVVDSIVASRGALQGPFTMFLHNPELAGRVAHLGAYVRFEGGLDMRVRVLAAMTVARELEALYVWGAQTGGARKLGVPESTISAIREARSRTSSSRRSAGTAFSTRPMRSASAPEIVSPVSSKRFAHIGPTRYVHMWFTGEPSARTGG